MIILTMLRCPVWISRARVAVSASVLMMFSPPRLSDEEERSLHMPDYLHCDGCIAVITQINDRFRQAHRHLSMDKDLKIWDVIETLENTCQYDTFT